MMIRKGVKSTELTEEIVGQTDMAGLILVEN
jgi:hypothetical protein